MTLVITKGGDEKVDPGFPVGSVTPFYGYAVPDRWSLCDGTGGTPDLRDRFIVGDSVVGTGTTSGTSSPVAALTHANMGAANHSNHVVTQPATHSDHGVTQPAAHADHVVTQMTTHPLHSSAGGHTHDAHTNEAQTAAGTGNETTAPVTHANQGAHQHDAHAAHSGMTATSHSAHTGTAVSSHSAHDAAVDAHSAHSMTQDAAHSILKHYVLAYIMKVRA